MVQTPDSFHEVPTWTQPTPTGAQQAPLGLQQPPPGAQQAPPGARQSTPLGGPISEDEFLRIMNDPLGWYLQYWLDIHIIGMMRGEDQTLLPIRIVIEQERCPQMLFLFQIRNAWADYERTHKEARIGQWMFITGDKADEAKPYHRDLDRLLVRTKGPDIREYIRRFETGMNDAIRALKVDRAKELYEWLVRINQCLKKEEDADVEATNQPNQGDTQS